jgi:Wiskott-Aldrich syndrome protein
MHKQLLPLISCFFVLAGCSASVEPSSSASGGVSAEAIGDGGATARRPPMIGFADLVRPGGTEPLQVPFALPDPRELGAPPAPAAKGETRTLTCRTLPKDVLANAPPPALGAEPPRPPPASDGSSGSSPDDASPRPPPALEIVQVAVFDHGFDAKAEPMAQPDLVVECMALPGDGPLALPQATIDEIAAAHGGADAIARVAVARFGPPPPPPGGDAGDDAAPPPPPPPPPSAGGGDADPKGAFPPPPRGLGLYTVVATSALADGLATLAAF